jgi:hypothetical protein
MIDVGDMTMVSSPPADAVVALDIGVNVNARTVDFAVQDQLLAGDNDRKVTT